MLKGQYTTINPVKELQQKMRYTNYAYNENAANKYANAGQLYNYLYMIDKVGKTKEAFDNFKSQYKDYDFLDDDYKDFVLVNETQMKPGTYTNEEFEKLSDEEKKIQNQLNKKTLRTWKDENGQEVSEEMTDYDWNKKLIGWKTDELAEERKVELFNQLQESKSFWQKATEGTVIRAGAFVRRAITGLTKIVGSWYNVFEGIYYFADNLVNAKEYVEGGADSILDIFGPFGKMIDDAYVKASKENELAFIGENMEKISYEWERDWGLRDYYGNYSHFDNILLGIAESFGQMIPTMLLSFAGGKVIQSIGKASSASVAKDVALMEGANYLAFDTSAALNSLANTSQLLFYAGMAQGDITEMLNDPDTAGLSSFAIFTNAYAKAGVELAVEKGLNKLLGTTIQDSMMYGFKSRTGKTLIGKLATDALHESLEEILQDYSHIWVDKFFTAFNYALGNEEYAEIFTKTSEFTLQTAMDAAISGALMSLIGSSFRVLTTKRVSTGAIKYDTEGNPIVDKKALKKFTKTGEIDTIYKTEKLSKGKSYMFNETMRDVQDSINTLMKDERLTVEEKSDIMSGLKSSLDTMTAIFNGFGQERFNKAMSLLNTMDTIYQQHKAASVLQRELSDYFKDFAIAKSDENLKRITDRQLKNPKYIVTRDTDFDTELEGLKAEKDTIQQILNDCKDVEKVTVTESGVGPTITEDGKTIIVPENQIKNLSAEALLKDVTEQIIVSKITKTPQLKLVVKRIYDIFKKLPINQGKANLTQDMAISYLLLNEDFARICLYTNESTMIDFISKLDIVVKNIDVKDVFTVQHRDMLKRSIDALSNLYMQYCIDMQYASPNVALLTDEQRANIENKRWNKNLTNKIQEGKPLSKNDLTNLDNRVNSLTVDDVTKNNLKAGLRSESDIIRIQVYDAFTKLLNEKEYAEFYSLFDNKTYPKQRTMTNMLLYNFLRSNGITLKNLVNKPEYKQLFEEYTDNNYTYEKENGIYVVKELTKLDYGKKITSTQEKKMIVRDYATVDMRSKISDFDRSILKTDVNSAYRDMIDINDVITMPSVLTDETRTSIKDKYGALTPYNTFKYLNTKFLKDSNGTKGINVDQNGNFYMVDVSDVQTMKTDTFDKNVAKIQNDYKLAKEGDEKAQERLGRGYKIKSFIQNEFVVRPEDASVRIIVDDDASGASYDELTNTISLGVDDIEHAGTYILHEYKHAIQSHNGLNKGFDVEFINADTNASDKTAIIKDMKAHMRLGNGDLVKAVNNAIYHGTGEASAYGYAFDPDIDYTVFIRKDLADGTITITTPWGAVYSMKGNRITIKQRAKTVKDIKSDAKVESKTEKSEDDIYVSEQEYADLQKNKAKLAKTRKQKYNKRTYVSKEREADTNLKYYGGKRMDIRIQDVIRLTTRNERNFDPNFIELIKDGKLITKSDIYDYVRTNKMDDNTFNLLNKNYFKNVNISSLSQLNTLVRDSANYYAIRAALKAYNRVLDVDISNYLYGALNTSQIKKLLLQIKEKAPNAYKIYQDVKSRYDTSKYPIEFDPLKVAYLKGYDGTLDSAAGIASWAKQIAMNKSLKRAGSKVDISTQQTIRDTKGENLTIGEKLAGQMSFELGYEDAPFADAEIKEMAIELAEDRVAAYWNKIVGVKNRNASDRELEKILKQKGLDIKEKREEAKIIWEDVMDMSDTEIVEAFNSDELSAIFNQDIEYRVDLQRNLQQKADRVREALAGKKKAYEKLVELYPDLGFTADKEWHIPTKENRVLNKEEILNLSERMSQILKYARAGAFNPLVNKMQTQIGKQQDLIAELQLKQKKLQDKLKQTKSDIKKDYTKRHDDIHLSNTELTIESTRRMPEKFKEVLDTVFSKLSNTKGKFANVNEMHTVKSYSEWIDANYDVLSSIDEIDAVQILDYIMNSSVMYAKFGSDDFVRFNAVSLFMLSYLYENADLYHIDSALLTQAERVFDTIKSNAGTTLAISRALMEKANPTERILKQLSKSANFGIKQSEIDELTKAVKKYQEVSKDNSKAEIALGEVEAIYQKIFVRALNDYKGDKRQFLRKAFAFQKMAMLSSPGTWIRNAVSNIIIDKTDTFFAKVGSFIFTKTAKAGAKLAEKRSTKIPKPQFDTKYNLGLEYAEDNYGYDVTEFDTKTTRQTIDKMLKDKTLAEKLQSEDAGTKKERRIKIQSLEEQLDNLHQKRALVSDLTNRIKLDAEIEKVNNEIDMYVNPTKYAANITTSIDSLEAWIKYNNNLDMYNKKISGTDFERTMKGQYKLAGTVIDAKTKDWVQTMVIESGFFDMIKDGLNKYNVSSTGNDIESKITKLIVESIQNKIFMTNQFDTKALNKTSELLYKMLSDDRWINRTFASYLGKMLVEDKIDLTQGYTDEVLNHIADAYTMAAWTYMHKKNFLNDLDNIIRTRFGEKAYFVYKQFFPFATTAYNWFVESLNFTPVGLITNMKNAMNLEAYINKLDINYAKGIGPNSRFASYILRRNIGKGLIGSAFWLLAALLGVFGVVKVKDDEYGNAKIQCGNVQIDFTDLYVTTGFGMGLVMGSAIYDKKKDVYDVLGDTLNTMFDDSIFSDVADLFKYNGDVGNILLSKPESVIKSFIPNILATFSSMLYNNEIQYSTGFKGRLEKIIARMIPGYAYALPTKHDIYTGEKQYKYYPSFAGFISAAVSKFTSVKINTPKVSDLENIAMKYGVMKGNLTGSYKDIGQFSSKQVSELNKKYGELNNAVLTDFFNNKIKYKVQDKKTGQYNELYYKQMTDEQKKTVITRIMSNNSKFAKIYVWTSEDHKYYCTKSEYYELMRLGITKNIRVGSSDKLVDPFKV